MLFEPSETEAIVNLTILNDSEPEGEETLTVTLFNPSGAVLSKRKATITITDDDDRKKPRISVNNLTVSEGDGTVRAIVQLSQALSREASVKIYTRDKSAIRGKDFYGFTKTVTFSPGEIKKQVEIVILDDRLAEKKERLELGY